MSSPLASAFVFSSASFLAVAVAAVAAAAASCCSRSAFAADAFADAREASVGTCGPVVGEVLAPQPGADLSLLPQHWCVLIKKKRVVRG